MAFHLAYKLQVTFLHKCLNAGKDAAAGAMRTTGGNGQKDDPEEPAQTRADKQNLLLRELLQRFRDRHRGPL